MNVTYTFWYSIGMLRKTTIIALLFSVIILSFPAPTRAFGVSVKLDRAIPFVNCGLPGKVETKSCCYFDIIQIDKVPWIVGQIFGLTLPSFIPNPVDMWNGARDFYLAQQAKFAGAMPCMAGNIFPPGVLPTDNSCTCEVYPDQARVSLFAMCRERLAPANRGNNTPLSAGETTRLNRELDNCISCASVNGYYSGIGCIQFDLADFITKWVFGFGISLAGLIALFCIIIAAIQMQLSQGNADTITKSREMMTSCILGLLLIIFSVFLLNLVGIVILPGLFF